MKTLFNINIVEFWISSSPAARSIFKAQYNMESRSKRDQIWSNYRKARSTLITAIYNLRL